MQLDDSCQPSPAKSGQIDWKLDQATGSEDETNDSEPAVNGMTLRNVMTQREMKILTALFPKSAQTLACVLRKRPRDF
jgi:hypothetical protein